MSRTPARLRRRAVAVGALTATLLVGGASVAQAHVHVDTDSNVVGTDATLTFRIPTESASASTTKVVVTMPSERPLLSVSPEAVPGWKVTVTDAELPAPVVVDGTTLTEAPHQVTWTATAGGIPPEQFAALALLVEDLPDVKQLTFPTTQYYSDGTVVTWDQPSPDGQPEPEHPVPTLNLVAADEALVSPAPTAGPTVSAAAGAAAPVAAAGDDGLSRWLSVAALVLALVALAVSLRRRRPVEPASSVPPADG